MIIPHIVMIWDSLELEAREPELFLHQDRSHLPTIKDWSPLALDMLSPRQPVEDFRESISSLQLRWISNKTTSHQS